MAPNPSRPRANKGGHRSARAHDGDNDTTASETVSIVDDIKNYAKDHPVRGSRNATPLYTMADSPRSRRSRGGARRKTKGQRRTASTAVRLTPTIKRTMSKFFFKALANPTPFVGIGQQIVRGTVDMKILRESLFKKLRRTSGTAQMTPVDLDRWMKNPSFKSLLNRLKSTTNETISSATDSNSNDGMDVEITWSSSSSPSPLSSNMSDVTVQIRRNAPMAVDFTSPPPMGALSVVSDTGIGGPNSDIVFVAGPSGVSIARAGERPSVVESPGPSSEIHRIDQGPIVASGEDDGQVTVAPQAQNTEQVCVRPWGIEQAPSCSSSQTRTGIAEVTKGPYILEGAAERQDRPTDILVKDCIPLDFSQGQQLKADLPQSEPTVRTTAEQNLQQLQTAREQSGQQSRAEEWQQNWGQLGDALHQIELPGGGNSDADRFREFLEGVQHHTLALQELYREVQGQYHVSLEVFCQLLNLLTAFSHYYMNPQPRP